MNALEETLNTLAAQFDSWAHFCEVSKTTASPQFRDEYAHQEPVWRQASAMVREKLPPSYDTADEPIIVSSVAMQCKSILSGFTDVIRDLATQRKTPDILAAIDPDGRR